MRGSSEATAGTPGRFPDSGEAPDALLGSVPADWIALLKPRVMTLVVFTALVGLIVAPEPIHPVLGLAAILAVTIGAGASGAINMWYDRDIDALMRRTASRPIPSGRIAPEAALGYGVALAVFAVLLMGHKSERKK